MIVQENLNNNRVKVKINHFLCVQKIIDSNIHSIRLFLDSKHADDGDILVIIQILLGLKGTL